MQDKLHDIIQDIISNPPHKANALLYEYTISPHLIDALLNWAIENKHSGLMQACIARKVQIVDDIGNKLANSYIEILKRTLFSQNAEHLDKILSSDEEIKSEYEYTIAVLSIKQLSEIEPSLEFIFQALESISSTPGVNHIAALMYCHDMALIGRSQYEFANQVTQRSFANLDLENPRSVGLLSGIDYIHLIDFGCLPHALYCSAANGVYEAVKMLVESGHTTTNEEKIILTQKLTELFDTRRSDAFDKRNGRNLMSSMILAGADFRKDTEPPLIYWAASDDRNINVFKEAIKRMSTEEINTQNKYGSTILHVAALRSNREAVKILCEKMDNVGINKVDLSGNTAMSNALNEGDDVTASILIPYMTPSAINIRSGYQNNTPLDAQLSLSKPNVEIVTKLIQYGADINSIGDAQKAKLLLIAIENNNELIIDNIISGATIQNNNTFITRNGVQIVLNQGVTSTSIQMVIGDKSIDIAVQPQTMEMILSQLNKEDKHSMTKN